MSLLLLYFTVHPRFPGGLGRPGVHGGYLPSLLLVLRAAAACARAPKLPAGVLPPLSCAVADWMRAAAMGVIARGVGVEPDFLDIASPFDKTVAGIGNAG